MIICPKSNKKRQRRPLVNHKNSVEKIPLKRITENSADELVGLFLETKWDRSIAWEKKYDKEDAKCIDHFKTLDSTEDKHIFSVNESEPSMRMFAKVSRGIARHHLATTRNINRIRWFAPAIIGAKPKVVRGGNVIVSMMDMQLSANV